MPARAPIPLSSYLFFGSLLTLFAGALMRYRIHLGSALPTNTPFTWQLVGTAQDALTLGVLAVLLLGAVAIGMPSAIARRLFSLAVVVLIVLCTMKSEAVVLFGATLHAQDFAAGPVATTLVRSLRGYSGLLLAASVLLAIAILWIAARAARRWPATGLSVRGFAAAAAIAAIVLFLPLRVHRREIANSPFVTVAGLLGEWRELRTRDHHAAEPQPLAVLRSVREMAPSSRPFVSDDYPLAYSATPASALDARLKPNIVFIAVEGLRAAEIGCYGGAVPGLTPNLDRLAAGGIRVDRAYSTGTYTPSGELGLWYGVLALPDRILLRAAPETPLTGLPEILREHGWRTMFWMSSTDQTFFKRDRFYLPRGFQMFDGTAFPEDDPRVNWGISDRMLARRAIEAMNRLPEPFAAMVLTVNNHHPYQVPSDGGPPPRNLPAPRHGYSELGDSGQLIGLHTSQMLQTVHYSDQAIGDFFAYARAQPWFSRTIFIITGDHGNAVAPLGRPLTTVHQLAELRHRVPLILYSPLLARNGVIAGPASHIDVMPTLLALLNIPRRTGLGADLLDPATDPQRPVFAWSEHERMLTIAQGSLVYHTGREEVLVDVVSDPDGRVNLVSSRPGELRRFRRLAGLYMDVYPALVLRGRSGLKPRASAPQARK